MSESALDALLGAPDVVAVLGRDIAVRLIDISKSGCMIHSETRLAEGTTGTLRLTYGGADYIDDVRIVRCQASNGGDGWYRLGAQFLWTSNPSERSLRRVIAGVQSGALHSVSFETNRQN
ncbi:MAG: PilZ domain-containing protein [Acidobacteria bacterium]|nr:PilZ domain-containing protein [Acidobacteriota bacterium]